MDARDSFSVVANPDGSSIAASIPDVDDDGVVSVAAGLAKEAALLFQSGKFAECLILLKQLLQKKEGDPKVLHNIAIAEYFRDGCSDPKRLLEVLNDVKKRSEELASHVETVNNLGMKVTLSSKGSSTVAHQSSAANSPKIVYADEFDTSVATLNIAVVWFHLHEYAKALSILQPLYQNIEPIDETIALYICLLLLDVALACQDATKSEDVLNYLEKAFGVGCTISQSNSGSTQHPTNLVTKSYSFPSSSSIADASNLDSVSSTNPLENPLSRTLSEETLEYETMLSTLDIGHSIARPVTLSLLNDLLRTPIDLKLKLQIYKVRFLLLTRNLKLAKREVKQAINIARGSDSSVALLLKSQLEYARGNHWKAIKLLMASSTRTDTGFSSTFNNNIGCIYYQLGKVHTSSVFFMKALSSNSSLRKEKPLKLLTFSQDKSLLIAYNCGLQYLACGKPILAARCFQKASLVFYNRPLLWFRLAECCLMALSKGLLMGHGAPSGKSEFRVHVICNGKWRHLRISKNEHLDITKTDDSCVGNDGQPKLSMSFARQCLVNALHLMNCFKSNYARDDLASQSLLDENESSGLASSKYTVQKNLTSINLDQANANGDVKEQKGGMSQENLQTSLSCYIDICRREHEMIKEVVLANLAYVELELGNPLKAISVAKSLLKLTDPSRISIFLGHVYAAEALCLLNRPKEAAEHLSIYLSGPNNVELPYNLEDNERWRVKKVVDCEDVTGGSVSAKSEDSTGITISKPEEAQGTLYVNLATMHALEGDMEKANQFLEQALSLMPNSPEASLTAVYLDTVLGKSQEAISKLKQCNKVRFLRSNIL